MLSYPETSFSTKDSWNGPALANTSLRDIDERVKPTLNGMLDLCTCTAVHSVVSHSLSHACE